MKVLMIISIGLLLTSCQRDNFNLDQRVAELKAHMQETKDFEVALEDYYGQDFAVVTDIETRKSNYSIFQNTVTGEYVAYNLGKWDMTMPIETYNQNAVMNVDIVGNLERVVKERNYYDDDGDRKTAYDTYYVGSGFEFENTSIPSKDLETLASLKESAAEAFLTDHFKTEFSLSSERSAELSRLAMRYKKLESVRELTTSEKDIFAMKALGVSMNQIEHAMKKKAEGHEEQYQKLLETAATVNRSTPEQIGKFFDVIENAL